jgi:ABC-2 type transport system permease protein
VELNAMLRRISAIIYKEYLHISRDRIALIMLLFFPVFILLLFGYAINLDIKHIPLAVFDQDRSEDARELTESFIQSGYFDLKKRLFSEKQINRIVDKREVKVVLRISPDFSKDIHKGKSTPIQLIIDGADNNTATITMGYSKAIMQKFSRRILGELLLNKGLAFSTQLPSIDLRPNIWYNPELKSSIFLIPGLIGIIIMAIAVIMTSITIVREKERGTMESLLVAPIRPLELMIGKITPYIIICFISLVLIIFLSRPIFNLPFRGNLLTLLGLSAIFIAASLGIGLYISNIVQTTQTAWLMGFLSSILPSMLLSGFIFPIESMPYPIQFVTYLLPIRYFLVILRGIILKGVGITILYPEALILSIFALVMITISTLRFKRKK